MKRRDGISQTSEHISSFEYGKAKRNETKEL